MGINEITQDKPIAQSGATPWQRFVHKATPYFFISPFFIGFAIFSLLPIAFSLYLSLAQWNGMAAIKFVGLDNFATLLKDPKFWNALRVSFVITVVCTLLGTAGATLLAVLLERVTDRLASLLRVIFFLPAVTSVVVITYVWRQLYSTDYGYFNVLLTNLGLPPQEWLADPDLALWSLIIMLIWAGLGWDALIITAGLRASANNLNQRAQASARKSASVASSAKMTSSAPYWRACSVSPFTCEPATTAVTPPPRCPAKVRPAPNASHEAGYGSPLK